MISDHCSAPLCNNQQPGVGSAEIFDICCQEIYIPTVGASWEQKAWEGSYLFGSVLFQYQLFNGLKSDGRREHHKYKSHIKLVESNQSHNFFIEGSLCHPES